MSDSRTINSIVLINGGPQTGLSDTPSFLHVRELYISTDGYLYTGKYKASDGATPQRASKISAGYADRANESNKSVSVNTNKGTTGWQGIIDNSKAKFGDYTIQKVNVGTNPHASTALIGTIAYGKKDDDQTFAIRADGVIQYGYMMNSVIASSSLLSIPAITVTTGCYGRSLPDSGTPGQIFFLID